MNILKNKKRLLIIALAVIIIAVLLIVAVYKITNVTVVWDGDEPFDMSDIKSYQKIHLIIPEGITINPSRVVFQRNTQIVSVEFLGDSQDLLIGGFRGCSSLKSVKIHTTGNVTVNDLAFYGCTALKTVKFPSEIKYKKLELRSKAFYGCSALTKFDLSSYAELTIEDEAFYECTSLKKMILPASYDTIEDKTFYGCSSLKSIIYPDGIPTLTISDQAFENCTSLKKFDFSRDSTVGYDAFSECGLCDTEDGVIYVNTIAVGAEDGVTRLTFREGTTGIAKSAFARTSIEYVELSSEIKHIGEYAFSSCKSLKEVVFEASCDEVPYACFVGCDSLEKIDMSKSTVKKIGYDAFYACTALSTIVFPKTLKTIGMYAFHDCTSIEYISACGVSEIRMSAFGNCTSLKKVDLSSSVFRSIPYGLFMGCTSLTEIILPDTVFLIESHAFRDCTSLETVTLPENNDLLVIYENAFKNCSSLKNIHGLGSDILIQENAFIGCDLFKIEGD